MGWYSSLIQQILRTSGGAIQKDRPEELYRLSGRGAVPLPEHLRKRIRRQMETLPDFAAYFSIQITEKQ